MKKILNHLGCKKVANYLRESRLILNDDFIISRDPDGNYTIFHEDINQEIIDTLKQRNIVLENSGPGYKVIYEDTPPVEVDSRPQTETSANDLGKTEKSGLSPEQLEALANELMPRLASQFVSKQEVNDALNKLHDKVISPEELISHFKLLTRQIKKDAREVQ